MPSIHKLSDKRKNKIKTRLKSFTVEDFKKVIDSKSKEWLNTDFEIFYSNNINVGTETIKPTVTITGIGNYSGTLTKEFRPNVKFNVYKQEDTNGVIDESEKANVISLVTEAIFESASLSILSISFNTPFEKTKYKTKATANIVQILIEIFSIGSKGPVIFIFIFISGFAFYMRKESVLFVF